MIDYSRKFKVQTIHGEKELIRINNCINGNPRYLISYSSLHLNDRIHTSLTAKYFELYRGKEKQYFVFTSYNVVTHLNLYFSDVDNLIKEIK